MQLYLQLYTVDHVMDGQSKSLLYGYLQICLFFSSATHDVQLYRFGLNPDVLFSAVHNMDE